MPDAAIEFVQTMKKAALDAMEASKPVNICFGAVTGTDPLRINVEQRFVLNAAQLILSRNVTDYETTVSINWDTDTVMEHVHNVSGKRKITIHNSLAVGDEVILIRQQEGQKYLVLDRTGK